MMRLKTVLIIGLIGVLCACSERKGYFPPNEIPRLTSECEMLSEKEMARIPKCERVINTNMIDGTTTVYILNDTCIQDTLPNGNIKTYISTEEKVIYTHEYLAQYPCFRIDKSFDRATRKLLSKEIMAPGYITIGMSYHYDEKGRLKEKRKEEKGYKFRVNQLLKLLHDKGIVIKPINSDYFPPDTTCIGELDRIDRKVINGIPCYVVSYYLSKIIDSVAGKTLEIDGVNGTILREKNDCIYDWQEPD